MFAILNRLRGTKGYFSHITGLIIAIMLIILIPYTHIMEFYIYSHEWFKISMANNLFYGIATGAMYILGESFGWGKWIGGVHAKREKPAKQHMIDDKEGTKNGIHYLANLIAPETVNHYRYCFTALTIRGFYWFSLTLLPLAIGGYISILLYLSLSIALGFGFPLSIELSRYSEDKFSFSNKYISVVGFWEHGEVFYGLMQDFAILIIFLNLL